MNVITAEVFLKFSKNVNTISWTLSWPQSEIIISVVFKNTVPVTTARATFIIYSFLKIVPFTKNIFGTEKQFRKKSNESFKFTASMRSVLLATTRKNETAF